MDATGYAETDNEEILAARKLFAEKLAQHKAEIAGEAEKVRAAGLKKAAEMGITEDEFIAKIYTDSDPKHLNQ